jgi:hypothetical protein
VFVCVSKPTINSLEAQTAIFGGFAFNTNNIFKGHIQTDSLGEFVWHGEEWFTFTYPAVACTFLLPVWGLLNYRVMPYMYIN